MFQPAEIPPVVLLEPRRRPAKRQVQAEIDAGGDRDLGQQAAADSLQAEDLFSELQSTAGCSPATA